MTEWMDWASQATDVIPDALRHALGGRLPERESPSANMETAALIRDLSGFLPCWKTA